ncbi:hypothetical protein AFCDBAGC_1884 [Methylobacterium cerastii]|uniref:Uncharacterized protein n=1 Tax=Methylobacterium cerastii TaxID=932741 RepID=A0ABQ4QFJ4_9HYPH|nr:hypothetical protein AFCDBAGC_1884 [Methylobacterium cerastii]
MRVMQAFDEIGKGGELRALDELGPQIVIQFENMPVEALLKRRKQADHRLAGTHHIGKSPCARMKLRKILRLKGIAFVEIGDQ